MSKDLASGKFRILTDMLNGYSKPILESAFFSTQRLRRQEPRRGGEVRQGDVASSGLRQHPRQRNAAVDGLVQAGMDPDAAAKMHKTQTALSFDPSALQPVIDAAAKYQIIPKTFSAATCSRCPNRTDPVLSG
jgi:hypothetical protein